MNKKVILVETVALLRHRYAKNHELHLQGPLTGPLNWFQRLLYWMLGYDYICGADYVDLMRERSRKGSLGTICDRCLNWGATECYYKLDMAIAKRTNVCDKYQSLCYYKLDMAIAKRTNVCDKY